MASYGSLRARVQVPGSRSITNRALVCASLADGRSVLHGVLASDDTDAMLDCLSRLGVAHQRQGAALVVEGTGGRWRPGPVELHARLSGTTSRFVLPLLGRGHGEYRLDAGAPMRRRPMADGIDALRRLGVTVRCEEREGHLPVVVDATGPPEGAALPTLGLPASVSSQFASGLLLAAPGIGLELGVEGEVKSAPYLDMTVAVMGAFGARVQREGARYRVAADPYRPTEYRVEPDASSACYFLSAPAVAGGSVEVVGLGPDSIQGDAAFVDVLEAMGAAVERAPGRMAVSVTRPLHGIEVDLADMSDQAPTLGVVAAFAEGLTRIRGVGFIRGKESDRIAATVAELRRLGVDAREEDDGFVVRGEGGHGLRGASVHTYDDHRIAMSFSLAGLRVPGVRIEDPGCVAKTFPDFFEQLDALEAAA